MSTIIRPEARRTVPTVGRLFRLRDKGEGWIAFPCDARGEIERDALNDDQQERLDACLSGAIVAIDLGRCTYEREEVTPALLRCDCGVEVELIIDTNVCAGCRRHYATDGGLIAGRAA